MYYILKGHCKDDSVQSMIQVFYPNEKYIKVEIPTYGGITICSELKKNIVFARLYVDGNLIYEIRSKIKYNDDKYKNREIKRTIYYILKKYTGIYSAWGMLTGIRPAKVVTELKISNMSYEEIKKYLIDFYEVDNNKVDLAIKVSKNESKIIKNNNEKVISMYIGIPFCPTRCLYCSFTAYPINKFKNKIDNYINALIKELKYAKVFSKNKKIESLYIGGGTPTSISAYELEKLLFNINDKLNLDKLREFTIEAGRPDTISRDKLEVLRKYNVSRISINPQTMNDKTLKLIGRDHLSKDFKNVYNMARDLGFNNINVDLILGLPKENLKDVSNTFNEIGKFNPENITVHTLTIKRASRLKEELNKYKFLSIKEIDEMLNFSKEFCEKLNMLPYYMYRQKNTVGNFENIGYCKKGFESIYNVQIMEERQTILSLGAGASSKFFNYKTGKIEKVFNIKDVDSYIERIDEMINRKRNWSDKFDN